MDDGRSGADLFDRVLNPSGPGDLKAVAPTGWEPVTITIGGDFAREELRAAYVESESNLARLESVAAPPPRAIALLGCSLQELVQRLVERDSLSRSEPFDLASRSGIEAHGHASIVGHGQEIAL